MAAPWNELAFILASRRGFGERPARWDTEVVTDERARGYHRIQLGLSLLAFALGVGYLSAVLAPRAPGRPARPPRPFARGVGCLPAVLAAGASARLAARLAEWTARPWVALGVMALVV